MFDIMDELEIQAVKWGTGDNGGINNELRALIKALFWGRIAKARHSFF